MAKFGPFCRRDNCPGVRGFGQVDYPFWYDHLFYMFAWNWRMVVEILDGTFDCLLKA